MRFFDVIAGVAGAALCVARLALGDPSQEPLRVTYRASPNCGSEAQFLSALRLRAPRVRLAKSDEVARLFSIEISEGSASTHARLIIRESNGLRTVRDLDTKDCREAVDALALIAALAIDPAAAGAAEGATGKNRDVTANRDVNARNRDVTAPPIPSSPTEGANATKSDGSATPNAPSTEGPSSDTSRPRASDGQPLRASDAATSSIASSAASESVLWRWSVAGQTRGGLAPGLLWGGRLGAELDSSSRGWLAPTFRLWAEYAPPMTFALSGGRAAFSYGGGALEICPLTVRMTGAFLARPCVLTDIGWVFAEGVDVPNARSATRFRLAAGVQARFEWRVAPPISVELDIGCTFPRQRDRFRFDPVLIYESSGIGGIGALGATLHFP